MIKSIVKNWNEIVAVLNEKNQLQKISEIVLSDMDAIVEFLKLFETTFNILQQSGGNLHECLPCYINLQNSGR